MDNFEGKIEVIKQLLETKNYNLLIQKFDIIISDNDFYKFNILSELLEILKNSNQGKEKILSNFLKLLDNSFEDETIHLLEVVQGIPGGKEIIYNNIKQVYKKIDVEDIPEMIEMLDTEAKKAVYKENKFAYELRKKELIDDEILGTIIKSRMSDFVKLMIEEVSEGKAIKKIAKGTYSIVLETNGCVIKLGESREKFEIPYHPNIIQPLLREEVKDEDGNTVFVAEVQPKVDTKNVKPEHIEYLKKKLKESGIIYRDFSDIDDNPNIGILLKPNKRFLLKGVGGIIDSGVEEREAGVGEPVIIDTDLLEKE